MEVLIKSRADEITIFFNYHIFFGLFFLRFRQTQAMVQFAVYSLKYFSKSALVIGDGTEKGMQRLTHSTRFHIVLYR